MRLRWRPPLQVPPIQVEPLRIDHRVTHEYLPKPKAKALVVRLCTVEGALIWTWHFDAFVGGQYDLELGALPEHLRDRGRYVLRVEPQY